MSFRCKLGFHPWNGCKCSECGKTREEQHDWSNDCESCPICGKTRLNQHDWLKDCETCSICGKTRLNQHDWSHDCENCSKCGKYNANQHSWGKDDCSKCSKCSIKRNENHFWDGFKCLKCNMKIPDSNSWLPQIEISPEIVKFDDCYFHNYISKGISIRFDKPDMPTAIFIYAEGMNGFQQYQSELPFGFSMQHSREQIEEIIGLPDESEEGLKNLEDFVMNCWVKYTMKGFSIEYDTIYSDYLGAHIHHLVLPIKQNKN
jgi:hypothetical protein